MTLTQELAEEEALHQQLQQVETLLHAKEEEAAEEHAKVASMLAGQAALKEQLAQSTALAAERLSAIKAMEAKARQSAEADATSGSSIGCALRIASALRS